MTGSPLSSLPPHYLIEDKCSQAKQQNVVVFCESNGTCRRGLDLVLIVKVDVVPEQLANLMLNFNNQGVCEQRKKTQRNDGERT